MLRIDRNGFGPVQATHNVVYCVHSLFKTSLPEVHLFSTVVLHNVMPGGYDAGRDYLAMEEEVRHSGMR